MSNNDNLGSAPLQFSIIFEHDYMDGIDMDVQVTALVRSLIEQGATFEDLMDECLYGIRDSDPGTIQRHFYEAVTMKIIEILLLLTRATFWSLAHLHNQEAGGQDGQNNDDQAPQNDDQAPPQ